MPVVLVAVGSVWSSRRQMNCLWAILNGGQSSRFGSPKYLAERNGESFLDISLKRINKVISGADRIVLSGGPAPDAVWEVVADSAHYSGPVAGLHSLLLVATQEKFDVLIVQPIDMPMLQPDQLRLMRDHVSRVEGIVVAESQLSKDRHWVLAGVHCSQYQEVIAHIESGTGGSLKNLWSACACEFINFPDEFLVNVNYPLITDER